MKKDSRLNCGYELNQVFKSSHPIVAINFCQRPKGHKGQHRYTDESLSRKTVSDREAKQTNTCPFSHNDPPLRCDCGKPYRHKADHVCFDLKCGFTWQ